MISISIYTLHTNHPAKSNKVQEAILIIRRNYQAELKVIASKVKMTDQIKNGLAP